MIGIDDSILNNFIGRNNSEENRKARKLVLEHCSAENPGFVSLGVTFSVIEQWRSKDVDMSTSATVLLKLFQLPHLVFEHGKELIWSLTLVSEGHEAGSLLMAKLNKQEHCCSTTVTLDESLSKRLPHYFMPPETWDE